MNLDEIIRASETEKINQEIESMRNTFSKNVNAITNHDLKNESPECKEFKLALDKFFEHVRAVAQSRLDGAVHVFYAKVMNLPDRKFVPECLHGVETSSFE